MRLETKTRIFHVFYIISLVFMAFSTLLGLSIGCLTGPLGMIVGTVAGFILGLIPAAHFSELHENARQELEEANLPYRFR